MLKGNCRKKHLTTCERKISSYKPALMYRKILENKTTVEIGFGLKTCTALIVNIFRNSHQRCSIIKDVLRNFARFAGKHLCQSLFLNKVAGPWSATLLRKRFWNRCFPANFVKFLRTPFLQNTSGRLLLFFRTYWLIF